MQTIAELEAKMLGQTSCHIGFGPGTTVGKWYVNMWDETRVLHTGHGDTLAEAFDDLFQAGPKTVAPAEQNDDLFGNL